MVLKRSLVSRCRTLWRQMICSPLSTLLRLGMKRQYCLISMLKSSSCNWRCPEAYLRHLIDKVCKTQNQFIIQFMIQEETSRKMLDLTSNLVCQCMTVNKEIWPNQYRQPEVLEHKSFLSTVFVNQLSMMNSKQAWWIRCSLSSQFLA